MIAREIEPSTAVELATRLWREPGFVWLDGDGSAQGARSYLAIRPSAHVVSAPGDPAPLARLRALEEETSTTFGEVPRFIGFLGYGAAWPAVAGASNVPSYAFGRYDAVIAVDHVRGTTTLVGEPPAVAALEAALAQTATTPTARCGAVTAEPADVHAAAIRDGLEAIARGDVYEVNLARRFEAPFEGDPLALFLAMRDASPVPFGAFVAGDGFAIASRSMERFLSWDRLSGRLVTRPIKGTIARTTGSPNDDARGAKTLRADEKERAEHVMVVDLMRNDLGRVAEVGSVKVESLFEVEPYAKLAHLVSTVACRTRPDVGLVDVLCATFPPGSVTGAPKHTAVRLIEALERHARGPYTGAIGYVSRSGDLSLAVAIRTAVVENGTAAYFAGGGIVEASDPDREVAETDLKAKVFTDAIARLPRT